VISLSSQAGNGDPTYTVMTNLFWVQVSFFLQKLLSEQHDNRRRNRDSDYGVRLIELKDMTSIFPSDADTT